MLTVHTLFSNLNMRATSLISFTLSFGLVFAAPAIINAGVTIAKDLFDVKQAFYNAKVQFKSMGFGWDY